MSIVRHESAGVPSKAVEHGGLVHLAGIVADDLGQDAKG